MNGDIRGTPTVPGTSSFTIEVTSGDGQTDTQALSIIVRATLQPGDLCADNPASAIATFEDSGLGLAIAELLSVGSGLDLTCGRISGLTRLVPSRGITSLMGIQNLASLTTLDVGSNSITDVSPLSGLTSLTRLVLGSNSITDITGLSGLTSLTVLELGNNSTTDISPLGGLTSLTNLWLGSNSITDISALRGLTNLTFVDLNETLSLSNIQPLLDNAGLGPGDDVYLISTLVSCADVAALEAKGVTVLSDC